MDGTLVENEWKLNRQLMKNVFKIEQKNYGKWGWKFDGKLVENEWEIAGK